MITSSLRRGWAGLPIVLFYHAVLAVKSRADARPAGGPAGFALDGCAAA
jgi:hypothetical protein